MYGYIYPNEAIIYWGVCIAFYPFMTGLVAGAFIVSSLYHVFNSQALRPVARFSLVMALVFLQICPLPLLFHAGRPERAWQMMFTPNFSSAMAGFGYIWAFYNALLLLETWLSFRQDLVRRAEKSVGVARRFFRILTFGSKVTPESAAADHKLTTVLAAIGIPVACVLHGYVGFIFGGVKANPWWSTALMPLIFLLSAIVSGIALLLLSYVVYAWLSRVRIDWECVRSLMGWLTAFLIADVVIELLEVGSMRYEWEESWEIISHMLSTVLLVPFFYVQLSLGVFVPLFLLVIARSMQRRWKLGLGLGMFAACLVLVGVWAMRLNVVVGGQVFSKSMRGLVPFQFGLWGVDGIVFLGFLWVLPFVILAVVCKFFPPWPAVLPATVAERFGENSP